MKIPQEQQAEIATALNKLQMALADNKLEAILLVANVTDATSIDGVELVGCLAGDEGELWNLSEEIQSELVTCPKIDGNK